MVPLDALLDTEEYFSKGNIYVIETWKSEGTKGHPKHRILLPLGEAWVVGGAASALMRGESTQCQLALMPAS